MISDCAQFRPISEAVINQNRRNKRAHGRTAAHPTEGSVCLVIIIKDDISTFTVSFLFCHSRNEHDRHRHSQRWGRLGCCECPAFAWAFFIVKTRFRANFFCPIFLKHPLFPLIFFFLQHMLRTLSFCRTVLSLLVVLQQVHPAPSFHGLFFLCLCPCNVI